ncbi:MAG: lysophospholipid acyltransferase family protein [Bacteroidaceae bacterium]|nr:lysophospholipid acyltransferase family protein [Bacteroidaceae bacterium]
MLYYILYTFSLLPLRVLFVLSDVMGFLLYHVVRYRRRLVRRQLIDSFPEKDTGEIRQIEKKFYRWFCDYVMETLKMLSFSEKEMREHMVFENMEEVNEVLRGGRNISLFLGHYCNWEWVASIALHTPFYCAHIYHPLKNVALNNVFCTLRGNFKSHNLAMADTVRTLINWKREGKISMVGYISDQVPGYSQMHHFVDFLNHKDTPVFSGGERMAALNGGAVYYVRMSCVRRGYYRAQLVRIVGSTEEAPLHYPVNQYFKLLEQDIRRAPQYWLWSHNRWKRTKEEYDRIFSEQERKIRATKA